MPHARVRSESPSKYVLPTDLTFLQPESKKGGRDTWWSPWTQCIQLDLEMVCPDLRPKNTFLNTLHHAIRCDGFPCGGERKLKVVVSRHLLPISSMNLTVFVPKMATVQRCSSICSQVNPAIIQARTLRHRREAFDLLMSLGMARAKWVSFRKVHVFSVAKQKVAL